MALFSVAADPAQALHEGASGGEGAHDQKRDAVGAAVVDSAHELCVGDHQGVGLGQLLKPLQVSAVGLRDLQAQVIEAPLLQLLGRVIDELGVLGGLAEELSDGDRLGRSLVSAALGPVSVRIDEAGDLAIDAVKLVGLQEVVSVLRAGVTTVALRAMMCLFAGITAWSRKMVSASSTSRKVVSPTCSPMGTSGSKATWWISLL